MTTSKIGLILAILTCLGFMSSVSSTSATEPITIPLWPDGAPGALGQEEKDTPTMTVFLPNKEKATGAAIVIFPGGGYYKLATSKEGEEFAKWLNENGIAGLVVKYRLGSGGYRHPAMLNDAARAMRTARFNAEKWSIDPNRIGVMGSSAGGHLASTILTHFDSGQPDSPDPIERMSSRPNLGVLCYAVITMGPKTHEGSRNNLLGPNPAPELLELLSNEKHVTPDTPPCFIWHTWEDKLVPIESALFFAEALNAHNVPFEIHVYQKGGHGLGLAKQTDGTLHPWTRDCLTWLKIQGFLDRAPESK